METRPATHQATGERGDERLFAVGRGARFKAAAAAALEIEAGRLAYQIPPTMWRGATEIVEVRLGRVGTEITYGFVGTGPVKTEDTSIVETMAVSLACEPRTFEIEARSPKDQLVKRDLLKGTALSHG